MKINERRPADGKCGQIYAINFVVEGCDLRHSGSPRERNALPGAPPLVVSADMWVFLWTEPAAVFALVLIVFKWAKAGLSA